MQVSVVESKRKEGKAVTKKLGWVEDDVVDAEPRALTREEAQALRMRQPSLSPWRVVGVQFLAGLLVAGVWWAVSGQVDAAASALYGAAAVVGPQAVMAFGLGRLKDAGPGAMVLGFMFWEFMKIGLTVAMLVIAAVAMHGLSWPALLVALVVCTKMNWLALLLRGRVAKKTLGTRL